MDAMQQTPQVQVASKPRLLVHTHIYANVLCNSDVEMEDGSAEHSTPFEYSKVKAGETTNDGMEMVVQDLPPKKKKFVFFLAYYLSTYKKEKKVTKPSICNAIKAVQGDSGKGLKQKIFI